MVSSKSRQQIQLVQAYLKTASDEEIVMWLIQTVKMMQNTRLGTEQKIDQVCRTFDIYVPVVIKRVCRDIIDGHRSFNHSQIAQMLNDYAVAEQTLSVLSQMTATQRANLMKIATERLLEKRQELVESITIITLHQK